MGVTTQEAGSAVWNRAQQGLDTRVYRYAEQVHPPGLLTHAHFFGYPQLETMRDWEERSSWETLTEWYAALDVGCKIKINQECLSAGLRSFDHLTYFLIMQTLTDDAGRQRTREKQGGNAITQMMILSYLYIKAGHLWRSLLRFPSKLRSRVEGQSTMFRLIMTSGKIIRQQFYIAHKNFTFCNHNSEQMQ
jgi:hypothetical protein